MESIHRHNISIESILKASSISLFILSAVCAMVYTTQNYTHAEGDDEDLGYDIKSANASVTVGTACTFTATVDSEHNATIANGIYSTDIGKTTLNTICNDSGGYAVYAIGYSNDEYGATDLSSDISSTYNISTGTNTSGDSSSWAMKLAQEPGTTTATIENGYDNYNIVPDDYTKVASLNTITDNTSTSSATGSSISTTYQTYISPTQPAGTYTGKVKYTLVHPSTAPAPVFMQDTAKIKTLLATTGSMIQAIDSRDGKKYWITKMADGSIWMTQNLDLNLSSSKTYTPADTDVTANWTPIRDTITSNNALASAWQDDGYTPYSYDPGDVYYYNSGNANDDIRYTSEAECAAAGHTDCSHYHSGNLYNWSAASASNDTSGISTRYDNTNTSICPAGWRLPVGRDQDNTAASREYNALMVLTGVMDNPTGQGYATDGLNKIRISPLWMERAGIITTGIIQMEGNYGDYWTSTVATSPGSYNMYFSTSSINPSNSSNRGYGYSVRCVMRQQ